MGMFTVREPKRFEHKYIYYDMLPPEEFNPESIRGKFIEGTTHLKRRKENGGPRISFPVAIVIIVLLTVLLFSILNGKI